MTKRYTDYNVVYELVETKKMESGNWSKVFFSLMAIRFISSKAILFILRDRFTTHEVIVTVGPGEKKIIFPYKIEGEEEEWDLSTTYDLVAPGKTGKDKDGNDIFCVATRQLLLEYIEQKELDPSVDPSKMEIAAKFVETLEASPKQFPPINKVYVSPYGRKTVYCFQRIT